MEQSDLTQVLAAVSEGKQAFFRYITANDVGVTGAHQAGFYVPKAAAGVLFDDLGQKGMNKDKMVRITWLGDLTTDSRFIYYGQGTRNEYRITRFGQKFPFLRPEYAGSLLVLVQHDETEYSGHVLVRDEDIEGFFEHFCISPTSSECVLQPKKEHRYEQEAFINLFLSKYADFPNGQTMAFWGQKYQLCCGSLGKEALLKNPDNALLAWIDAEYRLYQAMEEKVYAPIYLNPLGSITELIEIANTILNRRKSRAGKSLELHLDRILRRFGISFETQVRTEGRKRPDFIFPSASAYHSAAYPSEKLVFLAAKTTCKDRWRQILNEADRIEHKYLFTLQKGISLAQLREMEGEGVSLVVPQSHIPSFDREYQPKIYSLQAFIKQTSSLQNS